ncbi:hypothetical protein [Pararhodobacter sp.]|uniref:hypothetical protein n=1 Tax=Pararhodobacter sp. TaxID=2127056 RepID=UPI002AFF510A|nr:hypothetical protein [Pararhodobacter sp.]
MFFPESPDFLTELLGISKSTWLLGKREEGVGGNSADHRYLSRLNSSDAIETSRERFKNLIRRILQPHLGMGETACLDHLKGRDADIRECRDSAWQLLALATQFDRAYPRTTNVVKQFEIASLQIAQDFASSRSDDAIGALERLPWANTETVQWYLSECRRAPSHAVAARFPVQLLSLLVLLIAVGEEQPKTEGDRPGFLPPMIASRDPLTGELSALRYWFDFVQESSGLPSLDAVFKIMLADSGADDETRIRQGRKYRKGSEVPSVDRLQIMTKNIRKASSGKDLSECYIIGILACFLQKAFLQNKSVAQSFSRFDPMAPFNDWNVLIKLNIDSMLPPGGSQGGSLAQF